MKRLVYESLLEITTLEELLTVAPWNIEGILSQDDVTHVLKLTDCFWIHSGKPEDPHAILTGGKCSNGFINVLVALSYTPICDLLGAMIARKIEAEYPELGGQKTWVAGSAYAALDISHSVALHLGARHLQLEKGPDGDQVCQRFQVAPDETVVQVEELMTTLKTTNAVRQAIIKNNKTPIRFAPFVTTLVHRSPDEEFEGGSILRLAHYDIETWDTVDVCPLCKGGSERIIPKIPDENWLRLTGKTSMQRPLWLPGDTA